MASLFRSTSVLRTSCSCRHASTSRSVSPADYCVNLVKQYDHENFLCSLLLPGHIRRAAFCVRAFNIEVSLIGDKITEDHIGLIRYKWWTDALNEIYSGGTFPKHPVTLELSKVIKEHSLLKKQFSRLISARSEPMPKTGFQSLSAMEAYAEESTSPVYYLILQAAGVKDMNADHAASHLGKAQGLVNLIRSIPYHAKARRCMAPQDLLIKHNVPQEVLMSTRMNSGGVRDVIFDIASAGNLHLKKARFLSNQVPKEAKSIFLPAVAIYSYLERLRDADFDIFHFVTHERNANLGLSLFWAKLKRTY